MNKLIFLFYNVFMIIMVLIGLPFILPMILITEKRQATFLQRLWIKQTDYYKNENTDKPLWIHALSVGEFISSMPLIRQMQNQYPFQQIVVSVSTKTAMATAQKFLQQENFPVVKKLFFAPYDLIFSVKKSISQIDPCAIIIVESDLWPNFLFYTNLKNIPVILVNARLSNHSLKYFSFFRFLAQFIFLSFDHICLQTKEDCKRFNSIGIPFTKMSVIGNLKFDQTVSNTLKNQTIGLMSKLNIQKQQTIIVAGSTHKGEETVLCNAFIRLKILYPIFSIVVPRHPERAKPVYDFFKSQGFNPVMFSQLEKKNHPFDIIIVDVIGILSMLYEICDIAFIGGSLVDFGGHNPLEAAAFEKPLLWGQYMSDFKEISNMLLKAKAALQIKDADDFYEKASDIIANKEKRMQMGKKALKVFEDNKGACVRIANLMKRYITNAEKNRKYY